MKVRESLFLADGRGQEYNSFCYSSMQMKDWPIEQQGRIIQIRPIIIGSSLELVIPSPRNQYQPQQREQAGNGAGYVRQRGGTEYFFHP